MDLLLVKLTLTPLLMGAVSAASRRWGGAIGGLLAGLPLTAAPISIYLAAEQGPTFAAQAAVSAVAGVGAVTLSYLVYADASRRLSIAATMTVAAVAYALAMSGLQALRLSLGVLVAVDAIVITIVFLRCPEPRLEPPLSEAAVRAPWDLPARLVASTAFVLVVTVTARFVGPTISGLMSTIPLIGWPLIVFAHAQDGRDEAIRVLRGIVKGCFGLLAFYVIVALALPRHDAFATYVVALVASVLITALWLLRHER